ncbi:hypothetical protein Sinac_4709 [Singulisphaera acidiphila DSM 18658]|uniref:Uncharacterized protein n=1 Tax=Singulisphaera acidiphila (strain ATCC BAA-1392 / DSM 18658 / VKM B-2454 / MOB10) TaxID=886293 RepID=L0DJR9_SINAD|nr:hypothetical protein Sinac_4709 [Singulisphaera acidiphila DSM 18658]
MKWFKRNEATLTFDYTAVASSGKPPLRSSRRSSGPGDNTPFQKPRPIPKIGSRIVAKRRTASTT